jgi:hypothetical protein
VRTSIFAIIGLIMLVGSGPSAAAQPLSAEESFFVTVTLASLVVPIKCKGYQIIDGGLPRLADATGVDGRRLISAVVAAFSAANGGAYDREDLDPEVTRTLNQVGQQIPKDGKSQPFCKQWGQMLVTNHAAERR